MEARRGDFKVSAFKRHDEWTLWDKITDLLKQAFENDFFHTKTQICCSDNVTLISLHSLCINGSPAHHPVVMCEILLLQAVWRASTHGLISLLCVLDQPILNLSSRASGSVFCQLGEWKESEREQGNQGAGCEANGAIG